MILINMQYFGGNGAASGKSGGKASGGGAAKAEAKSEQAIRAFDEASTDEKIRMLKEHSGSLTETQNDDGIGDETIWNYAKSEGTLMTEGKDYTRSDRGSIILKHNREKLNINSKRITDQNDSVSLAKDGRSSLFKGKDGAYYMETTKQIGEQRSFGSYAKPIFKTELRKLPWKK